MSNLGFLGGMLGKKLEQLGDTITKAIVSFDPETATETQISQMADHVKELAARVAKAEADAKRDADKVSALSATVEQEKKAATILGGKLETDPSNTGLEASLTKLLDQIEGQEQELATLQEQAAETAADAAEWTKIHEDAANKLLTARNRLEQARREMERAHQQAERAKEHEAQAERDAGLKHGLDTSNIALDAMSQKADEMRQQARASELNAHALNKGKEVDDNIAAAMAEATGASAAKPSALDRLKKMQG
jgi:chromosome segregation ATPase